MTPMTMLLIMMMNTQSYNQPEMCHVADSYSAGEYADFVYCDDDSDTLCETE